MGFVLLNCLASCSRIPAKSICNFSTCHSLMIKWRIEKGIEPNPNRYGPLTNLPDYSFVDGRPTPVSSGVYQRIKLQEEYCKRIIQLSSEMDFAIERHKQMEKENSANIKNIIESKLKPKGKALYQLPHKWSSKKT